MSTEIKVAYQGVPGAYSEKATRQLLGNDAAIRAIGYESFEEAFIAVENEEVDFGVLPIQNSLGGSIHANYDLLLKYGLHIVGEYDLRVEHSLLALPGVNKNDIKLVISHPQALAQCANTISQMGARPRAEYDTAGSAKMLADNKWKDTAAIASDLAAEYYGLQVLERNVEDDAGNFTRFLLLSKKTNQVFDLKDIEWKTSLVFSFMDSNEKGQLYKALSAFSLRDIDLSKIESRPWGFSASQQMKEMDSFDFSNNHLLSSFSQATIVEDRRKYKYLFYVDIIGHKNDENIVNALRHLREFCKFVRVLGSYPTNGQLIGDVKEKLASIHSTSTSSAVEVEVEVVSAAVKEPSEKKYLPLNIGIYGFGNFGQFLAKTFSKYHKVRTTSRTDYFDLAKSLGCEFFSSSKKKNQLEKFFDGLDILVLCVSILSFESVVKSIPSNFFNKILVVDVLSVKIHPKTILQKFLPCETSILCTHPMFGPESGKFSWRGLPMMYEKVRLVSKEKEAIANTFLRMFALEMCRMLEMSCELHDEYAASSQFLTHLTGRILSVQGVKNTPIDTRGFKNLVRLVQDTCKDSFDLFQGLYKFNPNSEQQIQKFQESFTEVTLNLKESFETVSNDNPSVENKFPPLNPLVNKVKPAKTVVIHGLTKQLENEGKTIWSLCVGEPDFLPHQKVLDAAKKGFDDGKVKYTDVKGTTELRVMIAKYLSKIKSVRYDPNTEILVSNGAKQSVYQSLLAICKPGEKVIIPSPYWVSYPDMVKLVNAEPVILRTKIEEDYLVNPIELEKTLREHPTTKVFILCNPSNPAGVLHLPEHLERIAAVLRKPEFQHVLVISDEIYEQLIYQDLIDAATNQYTQRTHICFATLPGMYERTLVINGFSKSHAMPGLRIGYLAAPKYFVQACTKLQGQFTSCASSIGQIAATKAMELEFEAPCDKPRITDTLAIMEKKRQYVVGRLRAIPDLRFPNPTAAFYVFIDLKLYFEKGSLTSENEKLTSCDDFCEYLLKKFHVALVPGSAFGEEYGCRISYASSMETLENSLNGLENALKSLRHQ